MRAELAAESAPVTGVERINSIDMLRGIAVAGILVMNIYGFAMPFTAYMNPLAHGGTEWYNLGTWFFTHILFDQKFLPVFSILFGAGLVMMADRATARFDQCRGLFIRLIGLHRFGPLVQAVRGHAEAFGYFSDRIAAVNHLTNCFVLELGAVSLVTHFTSSYA
jgi:uncharacterized membrane protein YeiB